MRGAGMGIIKETAWGDWWPREGEGWATRREARGQMTEDWWPGVDKGEEGREANSYMLQRKWGGDEEPLHDSKLSWCHCESQRSHMASHMLQVHVFTARMKHTTTSQSHESRIEPGTKQRVVFQNTSELQGRFRASTWCLWYIPAANVCWRFSIKWKQRVYCTLIINLKEYFWCFWGSKRTVTR